MATFRPVQASSSLRRFPCSESYSSAGSMSHHIHTIIHSFIKNFHMSILSLRW